LAEEHYFVAWSGSPLSASVPQPPERPVWSMPGTTNDLGVYLFDTFGNMNLIYRDPAISSMYPLPIRPRRRPPTIGSLVKIDGPQEAEMLLQDVYQGLETIPRGTIRRLRLVGVPPKTHPTINHPAMRVTHDDPGKFVMGTVPVEEDGSAYFRAPSGVTFFLQALDEQGMAAQRYVRSTGGTPFLHRVPRTSSNGLGQHPPVRPEPQPRTGRSPDSRPRRTNAQRRSRRSAAESGRLGVAHRVLPCAARRLRCSFFVARRGRTGCRQLGEFWSGTGCSGAQFGPNPLTSGAFPERFPRNLGIFGGGGDSRAIPPIP